MDKVTEARYVIRDREQSPTAEAFRALVACIKDARAESELQLILFTGAVAGDGTAMTTLNTAASLAYSGKKVVLVDCDLRAPMLHEIFGLENKGISNIILDSLNWEKALQNTGISNLKLLAAGPPQPRPIELFSDPLLREVFSGLKQIADYVLINSSPLLFIDNSVWSDSCVLASKADGVVLVLDSRAVRVQAAQKALELLNGAKAQLIGTVLNDVQPNNELAHHICPTDNG